VSGCIHIVLLADASEFVYRRLKTFEPELLATCRAIWPQYNIVKVTVVPGINDQDAREAIGLGGTIQVFRRNKVKGRQNI
jgi:hypothetical protein